MSYDMSGVEILDALCLGNITLAENLLKQHPQHNLLTVNSDKKKLASQSHGFYES